MQGLLIRYTPMQKQLIQLAASMVGMSVRQFVTYCAFEEVALLRTAFKPSNRLRKRLGLPITVRLSNPNEVFDRNVKRSMYKPLPHSRMKRIVSGRTAIGVLWWQQRQFERFSYASDQSDQELGALAAAAKGAADGAGSTIDDGMAFIAASNKRIASLESAAAKSSKAAIKKAV
jgi:uncharacterized protein (DUF1778 family)